MKKVALIGHLDFQEHDTGSGHPERPARLAALHERLAESGLESDLTRIDPIAVDEDWLHRGHAAAHISNVRKRCEQGATYMEDYETMLCPASYDIARKAVGAAFQGSDAIVSGAIDHAFCAVRPPGHHAEFDRAMGFCLFNTVVIAARYIQEMHGLERVAIIDWDVHHGNGTQHILETDPSVFYFSIHQYPHYPGTGAAEERGHGAGQGATLNVPVPAGTGDDDYFKAFDDILLPAMADFQPQFVIVSAGFDAHIRDPLSMTRVTDDGFAKMTEQVLSIARDHAQNRLLSVLEGGYDLEALASSVETHLNVLLSS